MHKGRICLRRSKNKQIYSNSRAEDFDRLRSLAKPVQRERYAVLARLKINKKKGRVRSTARIENELDIIQQKNF